MSAPLHRQKLVHPDLGDLHSSAWCQYFGGDLTVQTLSTVNPSQDLTNSSLCDALSTWGSQNLAKQIHGEMPQMQGEGLKQNHHSTEMSGRVSASWHEWEISKAWMSSVLLGCFFCQFTTSLSVPLVEPQLVSTQAWLSLHQGMKPAGLGEIKILTRESSRYWVPDSCLIPGYHLLPTGGGGGWDHRTSDT